jgi:hypothetical protein
MSSEPLFDLTLTQLSADLKKAAADLPQIQRPGVSRKDLRKILTAAAALAPTVTYPLTPSIRVTAGTGQFIVNLREGRLQLVSWTAKLSPQVNPGVDQILASICGEEFEPGADLPESPTATASIPTSSRTRRMLMGAGLVLVIVGLNAFTFLQARKPPKTFLPEYRVVEPEPADRFRTRIAGLYQTGTRVGDRQIQIGREGGISWIKLGANGAHADRKEMTSQVVNANGSEALLTNRQALITLRDPLTIVYFGDVYTKVTK